MNICAIVVLYNPNIETIKNNFKLIFNQVSSIIFIDNSENKNNLYFTNNVPNTYYFFNNVNLGIAEAQNIGIRYGKKIGAEAYIFFDQDSIIIDNLMVSKLIKHYNTLTSKNIKVGMLSTTAICSYNNMNYAIKNKVDSHKHLIEIDQTISSGSFIHSSVLEKIGGMQSELFIDTVDFEWCWRATYNSYKIFKCNNIKIIHSIGERPKSILGKDIHISSNFRYYYIVRNSVYLSIYKNYVPITFKLHTFLVLPLKIILLSIFYKRSKLLKFAMYGYADFLRKKMGSYIKNRASI